MWYCLESQGATYPQTGITTSNCFINISRMHKVVIIAKLWQLRLTAAGFRKHICRRWRQMTVWYRSVIVFQFFWLGLILWIYALITKVINFQSDLMDVPANIKSLVLFRQRSDVQLSLSFTSPPSPHCDLLRLELQVSLPSQRFAIQLLIDGAPLHIMEYVLA